MNVLTDIGSEELGHMEMVATLVYKLTEGVSIEGMKAAGLDAQYADHRHAMYVNNWRQIFPRIKKDYEGLLQNRHKYRI